MCVITVVYYTLERDVRELQPDITGTNAVELYP